MYGHDMTRNSSCSQLRCFLLLGWLLALSDSGDTTCHARMLETQLDDALACKGFNVRHNYDFRNNVKSVMAEKNDGDEKRGVKLLCGIAYNFTGYTSNFQG
jgi:hypothetical protein